MPHKLLAVFALAIAGGVAALVAGKSLIRVGPSADPADAPKLRLLTDADLKEDDKPKAPAKPGQPAPPSRPAVEGPRVDARTGSQVLGGLKVWVRGARVSQNFENTSWYLTTSYPLLKITLGYECVAPKATLKFSFDDDTARASAVYPIYEDGRGKLPGMSWSLAATNYLKTGQRSHDTIFFEAPKSPRALDLDYAPSFLPAGQMFRFRIPADLVQWN
jgi:hypothetical protein